MLSFLNPSVLIGLFAALIPLIIHILNRRKTKETNFSTIHFLKQMARKEMRRLKIRQILLLILRTLIIILLILVFSRPTIRTEASLLTNRSVSEVVILIDNSLSLNRLELTGSLLTKLHQKWLNLETLFKTGDRISVILAVKPLNILAEREPYSRSFWEKIAKKIEPGFLSGNLSEAIITALGILQKSESYNKEIYIISDFQKNGINLKSLQSLDKSWIKNVRIFLLPVFGQNSENISVDSAYVVNRLVEKNLPIRINAFVQNHHHDKHLNTLISLILNGKRVGQKNINLASQEETNISFETTLQTSGFISGYVECENDALLEDNRFYFNFYVPEKINILHIKPRNITNSFIPLILQPAIEKGIFTYQEIDLGDWYSIDFSKYQTIIIENADLISTSLLNRILQYCRNGNGLILLPGQKLSLPSFNKLLKSLNLGQIIALKGEIGITKQKISLDEIYPDHPIFEGLFEKPGKLIPVNFFAYYQLKTSAQSEVILKLKNGDPILINAPRTLENIFLFLAPLDLKWNDLATSGLVVPLFYRMIYYTATRNITDRVQIKVGEIYKEEWHQLGPPYSFSFLRPDGIEEKITPVFKGSNILLQIKGNNLPGNYEILKNGKKIAVYSVNHDQKESSEEFLSEDDFGNIFKNTIWISPDAKIDNQVKMSRFGKEIWPYLLILALILLLIEMVLAFTGSRKESLQLKHEIAKLEE